MTTDDAHLKECPFCGKPGKARVKPFWFDEDGGDPFYWGYIVQCDGSGFDNNPERGCGAQSGWGETPEEASGMWNRRA